MTMCGRIPLAIVVIVSLPLAGCETIGDLFSFGGEDPVLEGERIPIMAAEANFAPDPQMETIEVELPAPAPKESWPLPGSNPTNRIAHLQATGSLQPIWQVDTGKGTDWRSILTASPIVADGKIFVLDAAGHIFVYDAVSGAPVWNRSMAPEDASDNGASWWNPFSGPRDDPSRNYGGGLAYEDGRLYVTTGHRVAKALDANSGAEIWSMSTDTPIHASPSVADGRVYVITLENQLLVLDSETGEQLWEHRGIAEPSALAANSNAAISGDTVIVPYTSGELYALRTDNGLPYWGDQLSRTTNVTALTVLNDIAGRPVVDNDMVFAISHSGTLVGINMRTGGRAWTRNVAGIQTPLVAGGFVYVISTQGQVLCLARDDGRIKWVTQLPAFEDPDDREDPIIWTGPLLVNNRLLLFSSDGRGVSLLPSTGQVANQIGIPGGTFIAPVMANGILYVLTNEAELVALR